ncbi:MAG: S8 family serine peptidase, partial [candidate division Zixibacteria bacterium]|nr:S8 family serine peptidase [candidate division Zixibacteria bacterium]
MKYLMRSCPQVCHALWFILLAVLPVVALASSDHAIRLKHETLAPQRVTDVAARSAELVDRHVLVQFDGPIDNTMHAQLAAEGIEVLDYVPDFSFTAKLTLPITQSTLDSYGIRWFGRIEPIQKIAPLLRSSGVKHYARRGDGRAQFSVILHKDADAQAFALRLEQEYDVEILGFAPSINAIDLIIPEQAYYLLAELDAVTWIEQAGPTPKPALNLGREFTGSEALQLPPWDLRGQNVTVAHWDWGNPDETHPDFIGRVTIARFDTVTDHAMASTGVLVGDGTLSDGLYRGMAPEGSMASFHWFETLSELDSDYNLAQYYYYAQVANADFGWSADDPTDLAECLATDGNYFAECAALDDRIYQSVDLPFIQTWPAGNDRVDFGGLFGGSCGSYFGWDYQTVQPYATAKNVIAVGAVRTDDVMTTYSSWGPCDDGRIKPDLVGPTNLITTIGLGGYGGFGGTSCATPAIGGTIMLLRQLGNMTYGLNHMLSSTYKAIILNTCVDLGEVGPDYQHGYGKIDAVAAAEKILMGDSSFVRDVLATGEEHYYDLTVQSGTDKLSAMVAWDDPAPSLLSGPSLVNDLDIVLIDPFGQEHFPWTLDGDNPSLPATTGIDHINNVEEVAVFNPYPGLWTARVSGYNVPEGPQDYSVAFTPDAIHRPGNEAVLAVFSSADTVVDAGFSTTVGFWVANLGHHTDSVAVHIEDDLGWIDAVVDNELILNQYDSVFLSVQIAVPGEALVWEVDRVSCSVESKTDGAVTSFGDVTVTPTAVYAVSLAVPDDDIVCSPEERQFVVAIGNVGNDSIAVQVGRQQQLSWMTLLNNESLDLPPGVDTTVVLTVCVPAEEPHQAENQIVVEVTSVVGITEQATIVLTVYNPYQPPHQVSPSDETYMVGSEFTFQWEDVEADSISLYVASDESITEIVKMYSGLSGNSFTLPAVDSLDDGRYYWAVRRFVGVDSSSFQRYPFWLVVDNTPPAGGHPVFPLEGDFVSQINIVFLFGYGAAKASIPAAYAPEFYRLRVSNDSTFTENVYYYESPLGPDMIMPDTLNEGWGYWSVQRRDSVGNASPWSPTVGFILDSKAPAVPTLLAPTDGSQLGGLSMTFRWVTDEPAP